MGGTRDDSSWSELVQHSFLKVFAEDEMIDEGDWALLKKLALADGVVDEYERLVLSKIFDRVDPRSLDPKVREDIENFRAEHGI